MYVNDSKFWNTLLDINDPSDQDIIYSRNMPNKVNKSFHYYLDNIFGESDTILKIIFEQFIDKNYHKEIFKSLLSLKINHEYNSSTKINSSFSMYWDDIVQEKLKNNPMRFTRLAGEWLSELYNTGVRLPIIGLIYGRSAHNLNSFLNITRDGELPDYQYENLKLSEFKDCINLNNDVFPYGSLFENHILLPFISPTTHDVPSYIKNYIPKEYFKYGQYGLSEIGTDMRKFKEYETLIDNNYLLNFLKNLKIYKSNEEILSWNSSLTIDSIKVSRYNFPRSWETITDKEKEIVQLLYKCKMRTIFISMLIGRSDKSVENILWND